MEDKIEYLQENPKTPKESYLPIFPIININREENSLEMLTYVRKKHRGKYYLSKHYRSAYVPKGQNDFTAAVSSFSRDIYLFQIFGKINPKLRNSKGYPVYLLDEEQKDEKERMKPIL